MKTTTETFLTPKQKLFCDEYLTDMNATRAALRAGYSATTALNGALMRMTKIKLYLQERTESATLRLQINQDMVLRELGKIAFANMGNYFAADGSRKPMHQLSDDDKAALWQVDADGTLTVKIRMHNKLAALDKIAKHLNFYKPEYKAPQKMYVYVNDNDLTEDDWFEDESERQEPGCKTQDISAEEKGIQGLECELQDDEHVDSAVPVEDVLRDSAGIAYGPVPDTAMYKIDLNDTPEQLLAKLRLEKVEPPVAPMTTGLGVPDPTGRNYGYPKCFSVTRG